MSKKQINLLTDSEISDLYSIPIFNDDNERDHFFTLGDAEHKLLKKYTSVKSKVYLIMQIGYFKGKPPQIPPTRTLQPLLTSLCF